VSAVREGMKAMESFGRMGRTANWRFARILSVLVLGVTSSALCPDLAHPQTRLRGTVREVHDDRVRVTLEDQLLPAVGDSAAVGQRIPGLGRVPLAGAWHVVAVEGEDVWLRPGIGAVPASPGSWAEILSWAPSAGLVKGGPPMEPTLIVDWDFSDPSLQPTSSAACPGSFTGGRFLFGNAGEEGQGCRYVFSRVGALEGEVEISARFHAIRIPQGETFGVLFSFQDGDSDGGAVAYNALLVGVNGGYKVSRYAEGLWTDLKAWEETDALHRGLGPENELTVRVGPGSVQVFTNGQLLGEFASPERGAGGFGIYVNGTGSEVAVDDLRVVQVAAEPRDPAPSGTVLSSLDFDDAVDGPDGEGPACRTRFQDGALLVANVTEAENSCGWMFNSSVERVDGPSRLSVTLRLLAGPVEEPMGLIFGRSERDSSEYFVFEVDGTGRYTVVQRTVTGWVSLVPWTRRGEISVGVGAENRLSVELDGGQANLFVNGTFLRALALPSPSGGYVGLYVDEPGAEVMFDEIKLERIR
jgi:hypothetical protein